MNTPPDNIIQVKDLIVKYGNHTVLNGINIDVKRGEILVILGGSGSGKSTLLRNMAGLMRPHAGHVIIDQQNFTAMSHFDRIEVRKTMGMCFQSSALFNSMTIGDNVAMPLREHTKLEESTIQIMTRIKLEQVGLGGCENHMPDELSGGMKKRAGLARAMAMDPKIIFYDEPSAGLDPIVAAEIDTLILDMQHAFGVSSIVVTHEMESVKLIADRVCMLHKGKVIALGTLDEVQETDHPFVQQFFARKPNPIDHNKENVLESLTNPE